MTDERKPAIETLAVHAGQPVDAVTGAVVQPIHTATTFERDRDGSYPRGYMYARYDNPNRRALEECLAKLEGAKHALAFSSGMGVASAVLQTLPVGAHAVAPNDAYHGVRALMMRLQERGLLQVTFVDADDTDAIATAVRTETKLIWTETPSNPLLRITDLAAVAEIARARGIATVCDGTFGTPVLQRPLDLGIDLVMHSTTKYIAGHSDVMGGVLVAKESGTIFEDAFVLQQSGGGGGIPSPFDCWLTLRGVATLPLRVRAQSASAMRVAEFLHAHGRVEDVFYPGLPHHPGHALAAKQMKMFGGVFSFLVRGTAEDALRVAGNVKTFTRATSLGGTHSLIEHRASIESAGSTTPKNLLRVSIGLENTDDLIDDLHEALQ